MGFAAELVPRWVTQGGTGAVVTWPKGISKRTVSTRTEITHKHASVQAPGCGECQGLSLVIVRLQELHLCSVTRFTTLSVVDELKEEIERLWTVRS